MASQKSDRRRQRVQPKARRAMTSYPYEVALSSRKLPQWLFVLALAFLAGHIALSLYHYRVEKIHWLLFQLFDLDAENNLPTWYSAFLLSISTALLWVCARKKSAAGDRWSRHWAGLALGFLLMSLDEVAGLHETVNSAIDVTWAVPAGIVSLLIGAAYIPFLRHLPGVTARRFVLAGGIYLAGVLGVEIIGNSLVINGFEDTLRYEGFVVLEEGLEMVGVILFIQGLLRYMKSG